MKKFFFAFATLSLAVASAANHYNVKLYEPAQIAGQNLKPGDYTIELKDNNRAVIKSGKQIVEADVTVEKEAKKFNSSVVRYSGEAPNAKIDEIRIGGTTTRLVFSKPQAAGN